MTSRGYLVGCLGSALLLVAGAANSAAAVPEQQLDAAAIVQELSDLPPHLEGAARLISRDERRTELYARLSELGPTAVTALIHGLGASKIGMRQNAAMALEVLSSTWYPYVTARFDTRPALPALTQALRDSDHIVRARSAAAIGNLHAEAAAAVPELVGLLENIDLGTRNNACIALGEIGPSAANALPLLRRTLSSPDKDLAQFARHAVQKITTPDE